VEDRLLQGAVRVLLEAIYENDFLPLSYGYRPGVGAQQAVKELTYELQFGRYGHVVEADIQGFLDAASYCPLIHGAGSERSGMESITLIRKPFLFPRRTWVAFSSPRFTRCNTVWRDTPRRLVASSMGR